MISHCLWHMPGRITTVPAVARIYQHQSSKNLRNVATVLSAKLPTDGHCVVCKTTNRFSTIPIDQAHEQNNEAVKGYGGAVGLTENPSAFRKWMVSGPEQARLLCKRVEEGYLAKEKDSEHGYHHEEGYSVQKSFKEQAASLIQGNPFLEDGDELLALDTQNIMDESVVNIVRTVESLGMSQYTKYCWSVTCRKLQNFLLQPAISKNCKLVV